MGKVIGIDLGNTNSGVAVMGGGAPKVGQRKARLSSGWVSLANAL